MPRFSFHSGGPINIGKLQAAHERFLRMHESMVVQELETAGDAAVHVVQVNPPFKRRSGRLQRETKHKVMRTRGGHLLRLRNRAPYAAAIDKGARAHPIPRTPKIRGYLHFYWEKMGRWVFAKQVQHPGNRPYRFLFNARKDAYWFAGRGIRAGMRQIARRF